MALCIFCAYVVRLGEIPTSVPRMLWANSEEFLVEPHSYHGDIATF